MARLPIPATAALPFLERPSALVVRALGALDGDLRELTGEDIAQAYLDSLEHAHALNRWRTAPDPAWLRGPRADLVNAFYAARLQALVALEPERCRRASSRQDIQRAHKATTALLAFDADYDYEVPRRGMPYERVGGVLRRVPGSVFVERLEARVGKHLWKMKQLSEYHASSRSQEPATRAHTLLLEASKLQRVPLRRLRLAAPMRFPQEPVSGNKALKGLECLTVTLERGHAVLKLGAMTALRHLELSCANVDPQHLAGMTRLESLSLDECGTLRRLQIDQAPGLRHLCVSASRLTGVAGIRSASLTSIDISHCGGVGDDGAAALVANLPALRHANLSRCGVGDVGVAAIGAGLPQLLTLTLQGSTVTGAGVAPLVALNRLVSLDLAHSANVGPDGCVHLGAMWSLTALDVSHCGIRREGAAALQPLHQLADLKMGGPFGGPADEVSGLTSLTSLGVTEQQISVVAARRLQALPRLYLLHAPRCTVSVEAAEELCKLLRRRPGARAVVDAESGTRELFTAARFEVEQLLRSVLVWRRHFLLCLRRGQSVGGVEDPLGARLCRLQEHLLRIVVRFC